MKLNKFLVSGVVLLSLSGSMLESTKVFADVEGTQIENGGQAKTAVVNERWGKPTFIAGAGLNQTQVKETMNLLGINAEDVKSSKATGADLIKYLGSGSGDDSVMISSVVVNREDEGEGITVDIVTPENITLITADQYKNPLITAGISDATVKVASVSPVTGESALTGVYKAFEENGETVDPERAKLAQDELSTTTDVASNIIDNANQDESNKNLSNEEKEKADEAYKAQLNQTLVDIKKDLADIKEKQGELATKSDIEKIVNDALTKNKLDNYVSEADTAKLVSLAQGYQTTEGVLDKDSIAQLDKISEGFKDTVNKFGDVLEDNKGFFSNLWQNVKDFFGGIGDWFGGLFNKEDSTTESTVDESNEVTTQKTTESSSREKESFSKETTEITNESSSENTYSTNDSSTSYTGTEE